LVLLRVLGSDLFRSELYRTQSQGRYLGERSPELVMYNDTANSIGPTIGTPMGVDKWGVKTTSNIKYKIKCGLNLM